MNSRHGQHSHASLLFFSGTGNSYRAAVWAGGFFADAGIPADIMPLSAVPRLAGHDRSPDHRTGVFFPTHGFTAPWEVIRHVCSLPAGNDSSAFVVATRGGTRIAGISLPGMEGTAGYLVALILALKGYRVNGVTGLDMPSNWMSLHWGLNPANVGILLARAKDRLGSFTTRIIGKHRIYRGSISLLLGLVLLPISVLYLLLARFFLAKLFFADTRCTGCGLCAAHCPLGAIRMRGSEQQRPYWTFACESCMRCMGFCPEQAIQASHSFGLGLWYLTTVAVASCTACLTPVPAPIPLAAGYLLRLGLFFIAYLVFWHCSRIPFLNRLLSWTTLTRIYRRYHEPETSLAQLSDHTPAQKTHATTSTG